ncbi:M14 family zinc carboxypeptidase [Microlunatus speluncae]|uniref:M14 family zinc carboxypeptidase n=1 Tax=Microlunatus speluncae TaxID=2594267 RepID=UPI0012663C08|nr:M14 family zinc carboxypeptidase [Microlunatus speluncae]
MIANGELPSWLTDELATVPDHDGFAGVDELVAGLRTIADDHPELTRLERVGTSQQGEPLLCLTIEPDRPEAAEALAFGLPHPNEPIGGLTALHLARRLVEDAELRGRLDHRWRIIACIDPDGLRLNEGWLKGPFTREHYARNFYRPAGHDQVEWTYPLNHRDAYFDASIPETQALMRLIDRHRPELVCSLHNSELGGVYYYLSRSEPELYPILQQLPDVLGLSLDRGEPESPEIVRLADGIYQAGSITAAYDRAADRGEPWHTTSGDSTASYAGRYGALTLISELPYWTDPSIADATPSPIGYGEALARRAAGLTELGDLLRDGIAATEGHLLAGDSPLWRAARFFATSMTDAATAARRRADDPESDRPATAAEVSSLASGVHQFRLRFAGILLRAVKGELAVGNVRAPIRTVHDRLARRYEEWLAEDTAALPYQAIEIRRLVATQYAATLATAAHLAGTLR